MNKLEYVLRFLAERGVHVGNCRHLSQKAADWADHDGITSTGEVTRGCIATPFGLANYIIMSTFLERRDGKLESRLGESPSPLVQIW